MVIKPKSGWGQRGYHLINSYDEFQYVLTTLEHDSDNYMIQEYVNDQEESREFSLLRDEFKEFHKILKGDLKVKILKSDMSFKEWFKTIYKNSKKLIRVHAKLEKSKYTLFHCSRNCHII